MRFKSVRYVLKSEPIDTFESDYARREREERGRAMPLFAGAHQ
jgi:hypothetical protein